MQQKELDSLILKVKDLPNEFLEKSKLFISAANSKLYTLDLLTATVSNRSISLINAYVTLCESENYLTAASLIRLQLDNALRLFAATLVKDTNDFVLHFIDGKEIRTYKDAKGKKLYDSYLASELDRYFSGIQDLYKKTCGYIHLSDRHFFTAFRKDKLEEKRIAMQIGTGNSFEIADKIDFTATMLSVSKLVLFVIDQWRIEKTKMGFEYDRRKASR